VPRARAAAIALSAVAFTAVASVTPFWRDQLPLAGGMLASMILLPTLVGARLRQFRAARIAAEAANAAKDRFLVALSEDLREPLREVARAGADLNRDAVDPGLWSAVAGARLNGRMLLLQLDDVLNCIKLETGLAASETRTFDLYRLANGAVAALRAAAAEGDVLLDLRIDPQLPYQLFGLPRQLRQILISLVASALRYAGQSKVRIDLAASELNAQSVTLRVAVSIGDPDGRLETADEVSAPGETGRHLGLAAVERMVGLMGGRLAVHTTRLAADLPFAIDRAFLTQPLDLAGLPALIVSDDAQMVDALSEPLEAWRGDPRWIGAGDAALDYLDAFEQGARRALLIVDGRGDVLQTLSWVHRAAALRAPEPPHILFIADEPRIDSIIGLAGGELDVILPAPLTPDGLRGALHSLTIEPISELAAHVSALPATAQPLYRHVADEPAIGGGTIDEPTDFAPLRDPLPQSPPGREERTNRPWQVLIATGNVSNRRILGSLLGQAGHVVHLAATRDEARKKLEAQEIDVLLLDLAGARGTDYEAARQCRRARPSVIIIALTTDGAEEAERQAREIGLDAVLRKPVRTRPLLAAIEAAVAGKTPRAEAPSVITSLSSHPRFTADATASERPAGILPLRQTSAFFTGFIDNFRGDCRRIVAGLGQAASAGDAPAFEAGLRALRDSTADFGAGRLYDLTQAMRGQSPAVLRQQGAEYVQLLDAELRRLDAALVERLSAAN
jgi:DNA-binding response OmpR family regulator